MDSPFDRPSGKVASLGFDGVCVYCNSILSSSPLGPFGNRFSLDQLLFSSDVSWLLVCGKADKAGYWADFCRHLEILCCIGWRWVRNTSDGPDSASFCDDFRSPGGPTQDGVGFSGVFGTVS